ncbi:hypothetical protein ASG62_16375 [Aureimonas sp. Leaf427]|nr:hypothetical protein ASG62_16375 [Aureimonas sp. Leaf427]
MASDTASGPVELATQAEVDAGIDATRVITPATQAKAKSSYMAARAAPGVGGTTATVSATYTNLSGFGVTSTFFKGGSTFAAGVLTIGAGDEGLWLLTLSLREDGLSTSGQAVRITLNNVTLASDGGQTPDNSAIGHSGTAVGVALSVGDVIRFQVIQSLGTTKTFDEYSLSAVRIGGAS